MSTGQRGDVAVLLAASKLVDAEIGILQPISDCLRFDLVALFDEKFYKIQVKRAWKYKDTDRFQINFTSTTVKPKGNKVHHYSVSEIDFIIGVVVETGDLYCFPMKDIVGQSTIQVKPASSSIILSPNRKIDPELYRNKIVLNNMECKLGRS